MDYTRSHINKQWYYKTHKISDKLCKKFSLSVIPTNQNKGKSYIEYIADKNNSGWKTQIKNDIDKAISCSADFEDFLLRLEIKGYTIKHGKHISFRPKDKERFVRGKTLGQRYTEENIRNRIAQNRIHKPRQSDKNINLIIDIENCIKIQQSEGYERWAKIHNLKQASKTINFLTEHKINSYGELESLVKKHTADFDTVSSIIKTVERRMNDIVVHIKYLNTYTDLKSIYDKYCTAKDKATFHKNHSSEIILFETAAKSLKQFPHMSINALKQKQAILANKKTRFI